MSSGFKGSLVPTAKAQVLDKNTGLLKSRRFYASSSTLGMETERVGVMTTRRPCKYCHGTTLFIKFKCTTCQGTGQMIHGEVHR